MSRNKMELLRKVQILLLMVFATAPVSLLLWGMGVPGTLVRWTIFPGVCIALAVLSFFITGRWRLLFGVASAVAMIAGGAGWAVEEGQWAIAGVAVLYAVLLLATLPVAAWKRERELPAGWYYAGMVCHVTAQVGRFFAAVMEYPWPASADRWLLVCFFCFAALTMLALTRGTLFSAANGRQSPSVAMRRTNTVLTLVLFTIVTVVALMPTIIESLRAFFAWLMKWLSGLRKSAEYVQQTGASAAQSGIGELIPEEMDEPGWLVEFFNTLFRILGVLLSVVIGVLAVCGVCRAIRKLLRQAMKGLTAFSAAASEDYEDEVTDIRPAATRRRRSRLSGAEEQMLPPRERIRYRYRRLMCRRLSWKMRTARENLPGTAAVVYEKARYSAHPITEQEALAFTEETKKI